MLTRLYDLFFGLCVGFYLKPTIVVCGIVVPWALIALGILAVFKLITLLKKFGRFLWAKFIQAIKVELSK